MMKDRGIVRPYKEQRSLCSIEQAYHRGGHNGC